ncbi:LAME_0C00254g1_1 [Lachancea meyersii CBS 8951]|uniref:LAME_0C00254g1_1 n=1 Tax=Lachancea meyersii CBS 8951 TaxID=1266667 RepID=A0A1G4IYL8_9SACH|nr:LAME_0C00254g1_1 [Lachancea meyersii CBS 8951]
MKKSGRAGNAPSETTHLFEPALRDIVEDSETSTPSFESIKVSLAQNNEWYHSSSDSASSRSNIVNDRTTSELPQQRIFTIAASMFIGIFLAALDNTVVSTLLPHIGSEFNEMPRISLVATSYIFACAVFQPLFGKISDIFGRKPLLVFSNIVFFFGCLICGLSYNIWWLILGRLITGIGGGGLTSMCTITLSDIIPLRNRAVYQGAGNFFYALGTACGGLIGGLFSEYGGGWRMAFLIQLPFCFLSCTMIIAFLHLAGDKNLAKGSSVSHKLKQVDWYGVVTLILFLLMFMVTITVGGQYIPYRSMKFLLLFIAVCVSGVVFVYAEIYWTNDPILPVTFLKNRSVLGPSLANWFCMMGFMTVNYYLPIYWSCVLNQGPVEIGQKSVASFFSMSIGSFGPGYYVKCFGKYYNLMMVACLILIIGQLQIISITPQMSQWRQSILLAVPGLGGAMLITITLLAMMAAVPQKHHAATTSISYAFRTTGCTIGISLGAAIFQNSLRSIVTKSVMSFHGSGHSKQELASIIEKALHSSDWVNNGCPDFVRQTLLDCYQYACDKTFKFCLLCFALTTFACSIVKEHSLSTALG